MSSLAEYFPPHQKSRKEIEDRIAMFERGIKQLQDELARRKEDDVFKYGVPVTWRDGNILRSGWKVFDTQAEAVAAAPALLPDLDEYTAYYKVEKVYI